MTFVVLKFGGTSLANTKLMSNAVSKVLEEVSNNYKVIVVVSAMAGVTDHLVGLVHEISDCTSTENLSEYANVITTGEQVSAGLFALLLQKKGLKARSWLGWQAGIVTDEGVEDGNILELNCNDIANSFNEGYQVAVVTGFQGITKNNRISTLGRGGSDTTAIIIAGALNAERCDIYTDVEGIFTADPRIVIKAKKINHINYDEMISFANAGAKVLQAKSVMWAKKYQVPVRVLSSFTNNIGTKVDNHATANKIAGIALTKSGNYAKISIIGTDINKNDLLITQVQKALVNKAKVSSVSFDISTMIISFLVDDNIKFNVIKLLHNICNLDES